MAFYTDEYKHLLVAERAIVHELENPTEETNTAMLATALTRVISEKRVMRGVPGIKPVDVIEMEKRKARAKAAGQAASEPSSWRKPGPASAPATVPSPDPSANSI